MADQQGRANVPVTENRPTRQQLTTIRPPHISRSALAIRYLLSRFASNLLEMCRIPERRRQIRPWRH